jgi:hypothetical protein
MVLNGIEDKIAKIGAIHFILTPVMAHAHGH